MKDYYYILGVPRTASTEEIKQAYRKLSVKFHPDKNGGDKFFEDRFKEINQAHGILSDIIRRQKYDEATSETGKYSNYTQQNPAQKTPSDSPPKSAPPIIISFTADKSAITLGEVITFIWATQNASLVVLKPFGQVVKVGNKVVKPFGFNESTGLTVELRAINELTGEVAESKIFIKKRIPTESKAPNRPNKDGKLKAANAWSVIKAWLLIFFLIVLSTIILNRLSGQKVSKMTTTTVSDSLAIVTPKDNPNTFAQTTPIPSQWKGNQLKDGSSPFNSCFGKGNRSGRSWILFKNKNGVDAVVCLINMLSGKTTRNEYIRAGSEFKMSNVPSGNYTLKVLFGNDWNPTLKSPCSSLGFFESDVNFSVSDGYNDVINVETVNDGQSITYSTHMITLYSVANGNMSQRDIDASQFFSK